jgi:predicted metalloprotease
MPRARACRSSGSAARAPRLRAAALAAALAAGLALAACDEASDFISTDATLKPAEESPTSGPDDTTVPTDTGTTGSTDPTASSGPTTATDPTATTEPPPELSLDDTVPAAVAALDDFWERRYPELFGGDYESLADVIAISSTNPVVECGGEPINGPILAAGGNALYCSDGDYIAYDARTLIPQLYRRMGDMAVLVVFAHEWGHGMSERAGLRGPTIGLEQQADCFAGAWAGDVNAGDNGVLQLSPGDLDEALAGLLQFRDPPGTDPLDPGAHGSAFQRIDAFRRGFVGGAGTCVTLHEDPPVDEGAGPVEGDLPREIITGFTVDALDAYWEVTFPELGEGSYRSFPTQPFRGGSPPACAGVPPEQMVGRVTYCPSGAFVTWDENGIDALNDLGDFAVSAAIADAWGAGILDQLGVDGDAGQLGLAADCLAGAWAGGFARQEFEVTDENGELIVIAAGDLDEAVSGFLFTSGTVGADASFDADQTAAFDRTTSFQEGFVSGPDACLA